MAKEEKKAKAQAKAEEKARRKAEKKNKAPKDHWFTIRGIRKEAKRVVWPHWRSSDRGEGIWQNTGEVVIFTAFFALLFVLCNYVITIMLKLIGIGA